MKVAFFGTPAFAVASLEAIHASDHEIALAVAQPDRRAGRGMKLVRPAVAGRAEALGIALVQPSKIRTAEFLDEIRAVGADIGVVVAYGRILPRDLLGIPPHGFVNVHGSLLPRWRGAAPIQRAIEAGDTETGVTIMRVDEELDHGPILTSRRIPIGADDTSEDLFDSLATLGASLLVKTLDAIERGVAEETPQNHDLATVAPMIERNEGRVDWSEPAKRIYDRYRAFMPWPGIRAEVRGEEVKLNQIRFGSGRGRAGTVLEVGRDAMEVACGEDSIVIERAQRPGKREVTGAELARGLSLAAGSVLE